MSTKKAGPPSPPPDPMMPSRPWTVRENKAGVDAVAAVDAAMATANPTLWPAARRLVDVRLSELDSKRADGSYVPPSEWGKLAQQYADEELMAIKCKPRPKPTPMMRPNRFEAGRESPPPIPGTPSAPTMAFPASAFSKVMVTLRTRGREYYAFGNELRQMREEFDLGAKAAYHWGGPWDWQPQCRGIKANRQIAEGLRDYFLSDDFLPFGPQLIADYVQHMVIDPWRRLVERAWGAKPSPADADNIMHAFALMVEAHAAAGSVAQSSPMRAAKGGPVAAEMVADAQAQEAEHVRAERAATEAEAKRRLKVLADVRKRDPGAVAAHPKGDPRPIAELLNEKSLRNKSKAKQVLIKLHKAKGGPLSINELAQTGKKRNDGSPAKPGGTSWKAARDAVVNLLAPLGFAVIIPQAGANAEPCWRLGDAAWPVP